MTLNGLRVTLTNQIKLLHTGTLLICFDDIFNQMKSSILNDIGPFINYLRKKMEIYGPSSL